MKFFSKKKDEDFFLLDNDSLILDDEITPFRENIKQSDAITPDEILNFKADEILTNNSNAMEKLKQRVIGEEQEEETKKEPEKEPEQSLLSKCMPYILDENGKEAVSEEPLYKLQSVADILRSNSEKVLESLSEKYDISIDDLGRNPYLPEEVKEEDTQEPEAPPIQIKNVQSSVPFVISDLDAQKEPLKIEEPEDISQTATITFTPISSNSVAGSKISVSTKTQSIDLTGELARLPETVKEEAEEHQLEKNEFEDFTPQEEITDEKSAAKLIRKLSVKKRSFFLSAAASVFLSLILAFFKLPFMTELSLAHNKGFMIAALSILGLIIIANGNMFLSLSKLFRKSSDPDLSCSLAGLITVVYSILGIINEENSLNMLLLLAVILCFRSLGGFWKASYMLLALKKINTPSSKKAVKLIGSPTMTFAMAKNSIEGDVLIAAPQETVRVDDFMKYSTFGSFLGGKQPLITAFSVILSAITGVASAFYFDGAVYGFYAAAAIQCFVALPMAFLIDALPLYRANKKLSSLGGAIIGKSGAMQLEMANAVVLSSKELFPKGTVTLHQMKVLSENDLQDTLLRAASLTQALDSTLAPVLKEIAGTAQIEVLPNSDTVKYEDKMGISGWVDNRLLFIGNRTLMEAHGIEVPSVEFDRKILRQGFFPVYVATRESACAVLIIKYSIDLEISKELRKLTNSGVTLLINNTDPNLTEEMICDYLGLYSDSVKVMTVAGCHMYKTVTQSKDGISTPAVYNKNPLALPAILNSAAKFKRSNLILTVAYVLCSALGAIIFAYSSFGGSGTLISDTVILLYSLASTILTYLIYLITRP